MTSEPNHPDDWSAETVPGDPPRQSRRPVVLAIVALLLSVAALLIALAGTLTDRDTDHEPTATAGYLLDLLRWALAEDDVACTVADMGETLGLDLDAVVDVGVGGIMASVAEDSGLDFDTLERLGFGREAIRGMVLDEIDAARC